MCILRLLNELLELNSLYMLACKVRDSYNYFVHERWKDHVLIWQRVRPTTDDERCQQVYVIFSQKSQNI
jgi:hypothetical protein